MLPDDATDIEVLLMHLASWCNEQLLLGTIV
jgi:hypothetical protein